MVGRHSSFLVTKRSLRNSDSSTGRRLRQVVQTKNLDDSVGLSRREEQELNKALYASLQENRRCRVLPGFTDTVNSISSSGGHSIGGRSSIKGSRSNSDGCSTTTTVSSSSSSVRVSSISKSLKGAQTRKHLLVPGCFLPKRLPRQSELTASLSVDESSQDSVRSSTSSHNGSKRKIHAQRKFAQGCSMPGMVSCTPVKSATPAVKMLSSRVPKTEDFLTFLCLRGSSILPAHLDFFNFSREELPACDESSRSAPYTLKTQREGTPDSSSTSSRANDEVAEAANVSTPPMTGRSGGGLLAKRSAARASAGTPETARGIVSLRQGLQRKVSTSSSSSSLAWPSASSSCLLPVSELTNIPPSRYRNKFYFTPEKTPSPSKASGIRTGEFTPPSLFSSATHMSSTYKFSPLVCCPSKFALNDLPFVSPVSQSSASSSSSSLSSSPVCGASKRKLRLPISSDAEATKVTCNHGSSVPSFCVTKCTRLDGLDCLSHHTPTLLLPASVDSASSSSILFTSTLSPESPTHSLAQTMNHPSLSFYSDPPSLTPTIPIFNINHSINPPNGKEVNHSNFQSNHESQSATQFKHAGHTFKCGRTIKDTSLSSGGCRYKHSLCKNDTLQQNICTRSALTTNLPLPSCLHFNTTRSDHPTNPTSICARNPQFDLHCLHDCSKTSANPQPLHAHHFPNNNSCILDCMRDHEKSVTEHCICPNFLCHLKAKNSVLSPVLLNTTITNCTDHISMNTCVDNSHTSSEKHDNFIVKEVCPNVEENKTFYAQNLEQSVIDSRHHFESNVDNVGLRRGVNYCNIVSSEDGHSLYSEESLDFSNFERRDMNVTMEDENEDNISFSDIPAVKLNCYRSRRRFNRLMSARRKEKKKQNKYHGRHRIRYNLDDRRRRKMKKKYCLVKEVPKVKIRIVRRHSVAAGKVSAKLVATKACDPQRSARSSDNTAACGDFQNEFLKMLQAGGAAGLSESTNPLGNDCHRKQLTCLSDGGKSVNDFTHKSWRNQRVFRETLHRDLEGSLETSDSYSEDSETDPFQQKCRTTRVVNVRYLDRRQKADAAKHGQLITLSPYSFTDLHDQHADESEFVLGRRETSQMQRDTPSFEGKMATVTSQCQQLLQKNHPLTSQNKSIQQLNMPSTFIRESTSLADSITLRDKVISAFAKFNRKDIIASSIDVSRRSSGELDPIFGSVSNNCSLSKISDNKSGNKHPDIDFHHGLSECCFVDEGVNADSANEKLSEDSIGKTYLISDSENKCFELVASKKISAERMVKEKQSNNERIDKNKQYTRERLDSNKQSNIVGIGKHKNSIIVSKSKVTQTKNERTDKDKWHNNERIGKVIQINNEKIVKDKQSNIVRTDKDRCANNERVGKSKQSHNERMGKEKQSDIKRTGKDRYLNSKRTDTYKQSHNETVGRDKQSHNERIDTDKWSHIERIDKGKQSQDDRISKHKQSHHERIDKDQHYHSERIDTDKQSRNERIDKYKFSHNERIDKDKQSRNERIDKYKQYHIERIDKYKHSRNERIDKDNHSHNERIDKDNLSHNERIDKDKQSQNERIDKYKFSHNERLDKDKQSHNERIVKDKHSRNERIDKDKQSHNERIDKDKHSRNERIGEDKQSHNERIEKDKQSHNERISKDKQSHNEIIDTDKHSQNERRDKDKQSHNERIDKDKNSRNERIGEDKQSHNERLNKDKHSHNEIIDRDKHSQNERKDKDKQSHNERIDKVNSDPTNVSTHTNRFESPPGDACSEVIDLTNKHDEYLEENKEVSSPSGNNTCHGLDLRICSALDLTRHSALQPFSCVLRPYSHVEDIEVFAFSKSTQTLAEIERNSSTSRFYSCKANVDNIVRKNGENSLSQWDEENLGGRKIFSHCQNQHEIYLNEISPQLKTTDLVSKEIGTDTCSIEKEPIIMKGTSVQYSRCKNDTSRHNTYLQKRRVFINRSTCLCRHKTSEVSNPQLENEQYKIRKVSEEFQKYDNDEIKEDSENNVCHVCRTKTIVDESYVPKDSKWKPKTDFNQALESHLPKSGVSFDQLKVTSCVSICTQTDHQNNNERRQMPTHGHNSGTEVELGLNYRSVKVQVGICDLDFPATSWCQEKCVRSESKDSQAYDNVITAKMHDGSLSDTHIPVNSSQPNCQMNRDVVSSGQNETSVYPLQSSSCPKTHTGITTLHPNSDITNTDQHILDGSTRRNSLYDQKKNNTIDHDCIATRPTNINSEMETEHICSNEKNFVSHTPHCFYNEPRSETFNFQTKTGISEMSKAQLSGKQDKSSRNQTHVVEVPSDCYISCVIDTNLCGRAVSQGHKQTIQADGDSDDLIILDDDFKENVATVSSDSLTVSSVCSESNATDEFVIDLSIHSRSDRSNSSGSPHTVAIFDSDNSNSNINFNSCGEVAVQFECRNENIFSGILDLRQVASRSSDADKVSDPDLVCPSETNNMTTAASLSNNNDPISIPCTELHSKTSNFTDSYTQNVPQNISNKLYTISKPADFNMHDKSKPLNICGIHKRIQTLESETSSFPKSKNNPLQQLTPGISSEGGLKPSSSLLNRKYNGQRNDIGDQLHGESPKKGFQDASCLKQISMIGGKQLTDENAIVLHSYGSLNTGQGFALVNGQLQQCKILSRQQFQSDSLEPATGLQRPCKSNCRHSVVEEYSKSTMQPANVCSSEKRSDDRNYRATRQQESSIEMLEPSQNMTAVPCQVVNSPNSGGVEENHEGQLVHCHNNNSSRGCCARNMKNKIAAAAEISHECFDLSSQFEKVKISTCNPSQTTSISHRDTLKNQTSASDFAQFIIKPKHKPQLSASKTCHGSSQRKYLYVEFSSPHYTKNRSMSLKENSTSIQQDPKITKETKIYENYSSIASSPLSNSSWTKITWPVSANRQPTPKSYFTTSCVSDKQVSSCPNSTSDRSILRSAYVSDLVQHKKESFNSSQNCPKSYDHFDYPYCSAAQDSLMCPDLNRKSAKNVRVYESNSGTRKCPLSSKPASSQAEIRMDAGTSMTGQNTSLGSSSTVPSQNYVSNDPLAGLVSADGEGHKENCSRLSPQRGSTLHQVIPSTQPSVNEPMCYEASVPTSVDNSTNAFVDVNCPLVSVTNSYQPQTLSSYLVPEIPFSIDSAPTLPDNGLEENVLDVIMEELKIQIALLKEEIMRENQEATSRNCSKRRNRKNNAWPKISAQSKVRKESTSAQRKKGCRYNMKHFDRQDFFSNKNSGSFVESYRSDQSFSYFDNGNRVARNGTEASNSEHVMSGNGNIWSDSGNIWLNSGNNWPNSGNEWHISGNAFCNNENLLSNTGNVLSNRDYSLTNREHLMSNRGHLLPDSESLMLSARAEVSNNGDTSSDGDQVVRCWDDKMSKSSVHMSNTRDMVNFKDNIYESRDNNTSLSRDNKTSRVRDITSSQDVSSFRDNMSGSRDHFTSSNSDNNTSSSWDNTSNSRDNTSRCRENISNGKDNYTSKSGYNMSDSKDNTSNSRDYTSGRWDNMSDIKDMSGSRDNNSTSRDMSCSRNNESSSKDMSNFMDISGSRDNISSNKDTMSRNRDNMSSSRDITSSSRDNVPICMDLSISWDKIPSSRDNGSHNRDKTSKSRIDMSGSWDNLSFRRDNICERRVNNSSNRDNSSGSRDNIFSSKDKTFKRRETIFRSGDQMSRIAGEQSKNGNRKLTEITRISLMLSLESEPTDYIEISSDDEHFSCDGYII